MLGVIMQLDISTMLTSHKKILLKKEKRKKIQKYVGTRPKLIC